MIHHNQIPQAATHPVDTEANVPALYAQPFDVSPSTPDTPWAVETDATVSTTGQHHSPLVDEVLKGRRPQVQPDTELIRHGKTGQVINVDIHFDALPADAVGKLRSIEQYQIMIEGKDGKVRPFSPPFYWNTNGAYTKNVAGDMGGGFKKPPNSPDSAVKPGEQAFLLMRDRVQRLRDKGIVAEAIKRYNIEETRQK
jgi:hypothetical protein